ncbi:MAG: hypothetical protein EBS05_02805 [Proteobacteria bacterium]|nr:hypothetical protein [Pseudomonadota bacterium]
MKFFTAFVVAVVLAVRAVAATLETKPADPFFEKFQPVEAPATRALILKKGDRLAICGDSITQQQIYSVMMETYLTVCVPELEITARQYGWSGERMGGFLKRMKNDCLRFSPTIATTCYGMNDHEYKPYEERIGNDYRANTLAVVKEFQQAGVRVVVGSAGIVGKMPSWVKTAKGTVEDLNLNLCELRNIDIDIARMEHLPFADVFWPMLNVQFVAKKKFGAAFDIAGTDGVHPGGAGHLLMAHAFLKAMGLDGDLGTFTVDLSGGQATASHGHEIVSSKAGEVTVKSSRFPFCATGPLDSQNSARCGMALAPFNKDLNRLTLIAKNARAKSYKVTWGAESKSYTAAQLTSGVNLADDFAVNPFSDAFGKVERAVKTKQAFEQKQIQKEFRSADAKADMEAVAKRTEAERAPLAEAIKTSFAPVTHTIQITAE